MDNQTANCITLVGMLFDAVGGLYLAYDLLGGEKGPLSTFTRAFTYSLLLCLIYSAAMGLKFGLYAGIALGTAVGLHLDLLGRQVEVTRRFIFFISLLRAAGLGAAVWSIGHPLAAFVVALVALAASMLLPEFNISPELLIESGNRPSINKKKVFLALVLGTLALTLDLIFIGMGVSSQETIQEMIKLTLTVFTATLLLATVSPSIEWYADHVEPRVLGYLGTVMFVSGFFMQSLPLLVQLLK